MILLNLWLNNYNKDNDNKLILIITIFQAKKEKRKKFTFQIIHSLKFIYTTTKGNLLNVGLYIK